MVDRRRTIGSNLPTSLPDNIPIDVSYVLNNPFANILRQDEQERDPLRAVNEPVAAYLAMQLRWKKITALLGGTLVMREMDKEFLPQEPSESEMAYNNRVSRSVLYNMFEKTVDSMTGRPFAKPIAMKDYSEQFVELAGNIDMGGNDLDSFMQTRFKDALSYGHTGIMIDFPNMQTIEGQENVITLEQERAMNVRPYWVGVDARKIIGWRGSVRNGVFTLEQARIRETGQKDVGKWDVQTTQRVRVLYEGFFELYEYNERIDRWELIENGVFTDASGKIFPYVPLIIINFKATGFMTSLPPLDNVADLNISHWQAYSDYQNIIHVAQVPLLYGSGFAEDESFVIGVSRAITGPENSRLEYVELEGKSIEAGRLNIEEIENRAALIGAQVLAKKPAKMTATQTVLDTDTEISDLQSMVLTTETAIDLAFKMTAAWMNQDESTNVGQVDVYKDFGISMFDYQELNTLVQLRSQRQITQATLLEEFKRRNVLMDNLDVEQEIQLTENETPNMQDLIEAEENAAVA